MATTYHADIQKLYVAYFNRPADVDGLNYWETVVEANNGNTAAVSAAFAASTEYKAAFAGMGASAVVGQIYQNLFGHAADVPGLNYWSTLLAGAKLTVDTIVKNIADGAQGSDKTAFANKVTAATAFTKALDTAPEIIGYNGTAANNAAKAFISSITTDATLAAAIVPAAMDATVATVLATNNTGTTFSLTASQDSLVGSGANDVFSARIFDNQNTLQSGDRIDGGAGTGDRLEADVGNSQKFAITPETTGVEIAAFRAQAQAANGPQDTTDNNLQIRGVQIDAQRMVGVNQWESNNSRADLIIEDVRILDSQITKDITIAMVETDPGHVDFGVYFDQYSLRAQTNSSNVLRLQLIDTRSAVAGLDPLKESPYNGFAFFFKGVLTTVKSDAIDAAQTYDQLFAAIQAAVAATPGMSGIVVSKGASFTVTDTTTALPVTGTEIVLTSTNGDTINANGLGAGWVAAGAVPPNSGLHTNMSTLQSVSTELVTSKIILDDVGRGSTGGDLVVGGLSVGDTSGSQGVQRFEIEVRDNSKLQTINSTNNTLREVTIKNGVTSNNSFAYVSTTKDKGDLTVNGANLGSGLAANEALPGSAAQHNAYGFSDVRLIDASAMVGKLAFTAEITTAVIAKYINAVDFQANPAADNIDFVYTGGANDDTMNVTIDGNVLASNSLLLTGREDFTFTANGGAGNDSITVAMVNGVQPGGTPQAWYTNQALNANVTINAGDGDDVVRTPGAGNAKIDLGAGNDTVYTDNTGTDGLSAVSPTPVAPGVALTVAAPKAVWVFNTANQLDTGAGYVLGTNEERNLADLRGDTQESYNLYNAKLTVAYKGIQATVTVPSVGYKTTDPMVNQAIKDAINNNAVLNKLIVASDGPQNTLIVTSLIDGVQAVSDLNVGITVAQATALSPADLAAAAAAYGLVAPANTAADVQTVFNNAFTAFTTTNADYRSQFAETGVNGSTADVEIVGANSFTVSDNIITPGTGNDVIVLGTTVGADAATSSNETVVYAGSFGNDTIVHFAATGFGIDKLNFSALGGTASGTVTNAINVTNKSITILAEVAGTNDTAAKIAAIYTAGADSATAVTHVYVAYDADNIAKVYSITDAAGVVAGGITATLVGTIDLADTGWGTLTAANFT